VISIGVETLANAIAFGLNWETDPDDECAGWRITDPNVFAGSVVRVLMDEEEDGTTLVHRMLDTAGERVVEDGAAGVEEIERAENTQ
jgi:hypothetical protein